MVRHDRVPIRLGKPDGPGVRPSGFVIPREAPRSTEVHEFNKRIGTKPLRGRVGETNAHRKTQTISTKRAEARMAEKEQVQ